MHQGPLELLVATILSAQCTDQRVNIVTKDLFRRYHRPPITPPLRRRSWKRPSRARASFATRPRTSRAAAEQLVEEHGGEVPQDLETLVKLPGVGRKTANVVLGTAFGIPSGVVVDTHVRRISRRLGLTRHNDPVKIERDLMERLAQDGLDRLQPPPDPPRPPHLRGPQAQVRGVRAR